MNRILVVVAFLLINLNGYSLHKKSDSLFSILKTELGRTTVYDLEKEKRINLLRYELLQREDADFGGRYGLYAKIFEEYRSFRFDSAFAYVRRMLDISTQFGNRDSLIQSKLLMGSVLLKSGFYKEAFDVIAGIDLGGLSKQQKADFFILRARLNEGIAEYDNDAYFAPIYSRQAEEDFKNGETVVPSNDFEKTINLAFLPDSARSGRELTPDYFFDLIMQHGLPPHGVAMVATRISFAYTGDERILFLTLAALHDIRSSTKETLAIFLLGQELFKLGRTQDAYICMQEASRNATFYGARNRAVQIESMLPLVAGKLINEKQHERDKLLIGLLIFLIIAVVLFFLLVIYRRQMLRIKANELMIKEKNNELERVNNELAMVNKELAEVNGKLWESGRIKEELIGLFFKTCSSYIETIDRVKHQCLHDLKLGKYKEVKAFLNDVHVEEEKDRLYNMLDSVFLTMFPNFIASFNALLKKEDQIWPKSDEKLNATLRIFALMRLGINEHEAIARILDYSVSTVYTYKMRIKSRALVPANSFEQKIMEIKFIDNSLVTV